MDQCAESGQRSAPSEWCRSLHTCHSCAVHRGCSWERDKVGRCREARERTSSGGRRRAGGSHARDKADQDGQNEHEEEEEENVTEEMEGECSIVMQL